MAYDASQDPTKDVRERIYIPELLRGLAVTTRHFLLNLFRDRDKNTSVVDRKSASLASTVQYPEERVTYPPGYRGLHRLGPRDDRKPRCAAWSLFATLSPGR